MTSPQAVRLVAYREITERVRDRSFAIGIVSVIVMLVIFVVGPRLLGFGGPDRYRLGWVGAGAEELARAVTAQADQEIEVELQAFPSLAAAEAALAHEDVHAVLMGGEVVVDRDLPGSLDALIQRASAQVRIVEGFAAAGVPGDQAAALLHPEPLPVRTLSHERPTDSRGLAFIVIFVLYGQLFGYGLTVASGIVEEKATRVVEVLLSTLRPSELLTGKVVGIGMVGLLQLAITAAVGLGAVVATGAVELPEGAFTAIGWGLAWFVLGYALYACLFAVVGAVVSRQEELQNAMTPLLFAILGALAFAFAALNDAGSVPARVGSFIPLTAPMVMPVRLTMGQAVAWEVAVSIAVILASIVGAIALASRAYTGGALRVRSQVKLREALNAS